MKPKIRSPKSWLRPILISVITLLVVFQPLAPALPQVAPVLGAAQEGDTLVVPYYSLWLGGVDAYMGVPYSTELNYMSAMTIEAWVYRNTDLVNETLVGNGGNDSYWLGFVSGKLRFIPHGGTAVDSNSSVLGGKWTHVAVTYNGSQRNFYINGALDKTSTLDPGDITPNPSTELGIGHDSDLYTGNYFNGLIDEVRIWNVVRTPAQIQAGMFQSYISPLPSSLLGYWRMNGNASDETGDHDGTIYDGEPWGGDHGWVNEGGIPKDIRIPQVSNTPNLNGFCDPTVEYANATAVSIEGILMYLQHNDTDLWVCFDFGIRDNTRARLLLDPTHDRLDPAQRDDIRLEVRPDDSLYAYAGNDAGSWVITDTYATLWDGEYYIGSGEFPPYHAEFRVSSDIVGEWGQLIGLALDPYDPGFGGLDRAGIWPALAASTRPSTWSSATLAGVGPTRHFSGYVLYQPKNLGYDPTGVYGAVLELYGYDQGGSEALVAQSTTGHTGSFGLTTNDDYSYHRLELTSTPQGYVSLSADAPSPGTVLDPRTIDYGNVGGGAYTANEFILGDNLPLNVNAAYGPVFLIVAPQAVIQADALDEFVTFKTQQGYAVSVRSVEEADTYPGATRLEKIRALEMEYLAQYGNRFQFVMLVGGSDVIPFAKMTPWATGEYPVCPSETSVNYKFSDWPYVDLTSNWDSNGNGCYADGALTAADKLIPGYDHDVGVAFDPTVVLGRIPFSQPETVRKALATSIGFERQSESYKLNAINGMAMIGLKGYFNGVACTRDQWSYHCVNPLPNWQSNYDYALLSERMIANYLEPNNFDTTILYENEEIVAGGQGIHSPLDLTLDHMRNEIDTGRFGLATMLGHGNGWGVYRTFWEDDNGNGQVDVYSEEDTEVKGATFFEIGGLLDVVSPDGTRGGVFVFIGCSTAEAENASNLSATILADNHGPAAIGALSGIGVGSWFNKDDGNSGTLGYYFGQLIVHNNYRLGEAVWWGLADMLYRGVSGSGGVAIGLYGDPTLSFYGNPGGQATLAAWPMGRRDATGASYLSLPGPTYPKKLWEYGTEVHLSQTYGPTPLVSANGEVIVAHGTHVDILRQGTLYQRLELDAYVFGSPALSADGTIYVMDIEADLYAFPYRRFTWNNTTILMHDRLRRWKVNLGENPQASPVVGSDGIILAGVGGPLAEDARLWLVRQDGHLLISYFLDMNPTYYATTDASRAIYVATYGEQGHLYRFAPFCNYSMSPDICPNEGSVEKTVQAPFSTPPLLAGGSLYIGDMSNTLYKLNKDTLVTEATFVASSHINLGPIVSPNGDILFVTLDDVMYSLTKDLNTVRWQINLGYAFAEGIPAASSNAIYLAFDGYLHAYNPSSGAQLWQRSLGEDIGYASVSVGYGREIYVQGSSGNVLAFSEGWSMGPAEILAWANSEAGRLSIDIEILQAIDPISGTLQSEPLAPQATVVGVLIQRSEDGGPWEDRVLLPPEVTSFRDTDVEPNTSYAYRAQNLMSDGSNSDFTPAPDVVQSYPDIPDAPTLDPVQVDGAETLSLSWSPAAGSVVEHYLLERGLSSGGPFTQIAKLNGDTLAYQDSGLTPATTYYYQVRSANASGTSAPSNMEHAATRSQTLPAPQNFQAALASPIEIHLTWDAGPAGATAVLERIAFGEVDYAYLDSLPAPDGTYAFSIGEPGAYGFRIKYVQGANESVYAYAATTIVISQTRQVYLPVMQR